MTTWNHKCLFSSVFGGSLLETGESMKQMADLKYALDDNVKQNFLEPLHHLQSKDLKEVRQIDRHRHRHMTYLNKSNQIWPLLTNLTWEDLSKLIGPDIDLSKLIWPNIDLSKLIWPNIDRS